MKQKFKLLVQTECHRILTEKIAGITAGIQQLQDSLLNESKSTAGDKHETGRAMLQLEMEKLGNQLKELEKQKADFERIDLDTSDSVVAKGSLVNTDKGLFFFGIALGKITADGQTIFTLSFDSPLGKKMIGLKSGDTAEINGNNYTVIEII